jgi:acetyl-CoA carboxylase carboxyl transferase subunit beta
MAERLTAREVIALVTDDFTPLRAPATGTPLLPDGPLGWAGYDAARARAAEQTGEEESVLYGRATVGGHRVVLVVFEFGFLGGSLGRAAGDRLVAAYRTARAARVPLVSLVATGGSRMQEGMIALTQLQRVAEATVRLRAAGVPHVTVLRDPSTGGGWATVGAGADVVLALPSAQVAFAGSRVRPRDADPAAYTAEDQWECGQVDALVDPADLRATLSLWLRLLTGGAPGGLPGETPGAPGGTSGVAPESPDGPSGETPHAPGGPPGETPYAPGSGETPDPAPPPRALAEAGPPGTGWEAVVRARSAARPRAGAYLDAYFTARATVRGDRAGGVDPGVECGFGLHEGRTVAYAAQDGSATRPAGFRTVARLVRLADRLGVPVLTLIDTPGAANDAEAERAGARVPVTSLLVGEGGSGGALALAARDNTWTTPDGYFSVIAPELAAAILKRTPDHAAVTADQLRLRPQDLVELGIVRGIVTRDAP